MEMNTIPTELYAAIYKPPRARKWRVWNLIFSPDKEHITEKARKWWGPEGYNYKWKIITYKLPKKELQTP
jgi:hypothetical protein